MPTQDEKVVNLALSGTELQAILREHFEKLLRNEGMLSPHIAFGRVSGDITLRLHLDNAFWPESTITMPLSGDGIESVPLKNPSPEATVAAQTLSFGIDSPNAERVRFGMPVPVVTKELDGTTQIQEVKYPPQPELGEGNVTLVDTTEDARRKWNL